MMDHDDTLREMARRCAETDREGGIWYCPQPYWGHDDWLAFSYWLSYYRDEKSDQ